MTFAYRFRSMTSLLGEYAELEKQQIFFAEQSQLNDPMEGFKSLFWQGDAVLWENLFRHYIGCFYYAACAVHIAGELHPIDWRHVPLRSPREAARTPAERALIEELTAIFLAHEDVQGLVAVLAKRQGPVRENELKAYLAALHPLAIFEAFALFRRHGLMRPGPDVDVHTQPEHKAGWVVQLAALSEALQDQTEPARAREAVFAAHANVSHQLDLIHRYNWSISGSAANRAFVLLDFPHDYPRKLEQLVYPTFYTACFAASHTNSSVWGHYSDGHRGACLIFNTEAVHDHRAITLRRFAGAGTTGPFDDTRTHVLFPVRYQGTAPEVDFFRMLAMLPVPIINAEWYQNRDKQRTTRSDCILDANQDQLRAHWADFEQFTTTKSSNWAYEEEMRLTWHSAIFDLTESARRVTTYDFSALRGIAFGMKTTAEHKTAIMHIIDRKCALAQRYDFKFYQAYYAPQTGTVELAELGLVKFSPS